MNTPGSKKVAVAALLGNLGVALANFVAAFLSSSVAMLAEGVHPVADPGKINELERKIRAKLPRMTRIFIEPESHGDSVASETEAA